MTAEYGDAAKRCADRVNLAVVCGAIGSVLAIRLSDGGSDGAEYDSITDARKHQLHPEQCCYVHVVEGGMSEREAESFLRFNRGAYDGGYRMTDPSNPTELIMPMTGGLE